MPADKLFLTYVGVNTVFLGTGALLIIFAIKTNDDVAKDPTVDNAARNLLLKIQCPLNAAIGNAVLVFIAFMLSLPGMVMPMTRGWLKASGYLVAVCAVFTLVLGLDIWFHTLQTRNELSEIWNEQPANVQSLLQQGLNCCGYFNSTFPPYIPDATCTNPQVAAARIGCITPFSTYANNFLDLIFTGAFGIVGLDVVLILTIAMLLKDRKEKVRYLHLDEKSGVRAF